MAAWSRATFDPELVGPDIANLNLVRVIRAKYPTLNDIEDSQGLATILAVEPSGSRRSNIVAAIVRLGILSPEIPTAASFTAGRRISDYLLTEVVGEECQKRNLAKWMSENVESLDKFSASLALATFLGLPVEDRESPVKMAAGLVAKGLVSSDRPVGQAISNYHRLSNYLLEEVVGAKKARQNLSGWLTENISTLDDVPTNLHALGSAINLDKLSARSATKCAARLIELGHLSPEMPDLHPPSKGGRPSYYLDSSVVGAEMANKNLRRIIQTNYDSLDNISKTSPHFHTLCSVLGLKRSAPALRQKLIELDWIPEPKKNGGKTTLPDIFCHDFQFRSRISDNAKEKPIGVECIRNNHQELRFLKGEVFEQIVGLYLAYQSPQEVLWPQYCLVVDPKSGYFGKRVDWRIGNDLVEVKYGGAEQNIHETHAKHIQSLPVGFNYRIITLLKNERVEIATEHFPDLISTHPLNESARVILEFVEQQISDSDFLSVEKLRTLRDALHSAVTRATDSVGSERTEMINMSLNSIRNSLQSLDALNAHATWSFPNLKATFEYEGIVYTGRISIPEYQSENNGERYSLVYTFASSKFRQALDRDIAIMIELSQGYQREFQVVEKPRDGILKEPIFILPDGRTLTTREGTDASTTISNLNEIQAILSFPEGYYDWGLAYIAAFGVRA
jgi:hypothetical protein